VVNVVNKCYKDLLNELIVFQNLSALHDSDDGCL